MVFRHPTFWGLTLLLTAGLSVSEPAVAMPLAAPSSQLISQLTSPDGENIVRGTVVGINGNEVTIRLENGETETYLISTSDQERFGLGPGRSFDFTVDGDDIIAAAQVEVIEGSSETITETVEASDLGINPEVETEMETEVETETVETTEVVETEVVQTETTVQERPAPAPTAAPAPVEPIRGLW
jgi:hypothetical protein